MSTTTTRKSLIFIPLLLAFAVALQDGDQVAFKTHGSFFNAKYQYLNAGTVDGSVSMAKNTDYASASGTWWRAHLLSDGSWAFESLGNIPNAQHIYLNANTYTGTIDLAGSTDYKTVSGTHWALQTLSDGKIALKSLGSHKNRKYLYLNTDTYIGAVNLAASTNFRSLSGTHWEIVPLAPAIPVANTQLADFINAHADDLKADSSIDVGYCLQQFDPTAFAAKYGPIILSIIEAGCANGLQNCNMDDLYGVLNRLKGSGTSDDTMKKLYIFIGSIIGTMAGESSCAGFKPCEMLGGRIGAVLTCLAVTKEVYQAMENAISTLKNAANQAGDIGQDTANAINDAANSVENGVQDAITQINNGATNDAVSTLKGVTDEVGQGFTDLGNQIVGGLKDAGGAIAGAGQQAGGAIAGAGEQAGGAIVGAGEQARGAIVDVGNQVANGFCGIFGC